MASSVLQTIGLLLGVLSAICTILAVVMPEWRRNDYSGEIIEAVMRHQGLWASCISYATGLWQCDAYDSFFLGLPLKLQVARGLALTAIAAYCVALLLSIFGMECTKCMSESVRTKTRVALLSAGFWIFASLAIGSAVSFFAHQVVQDFTFAELLDDVIQDLSVKYVFGNSLFLGWAAMALGTLGGAIMLCGSCYVESEDDEYWNKGRVGQGLQRMRNSFRESYRAVRPRKAGQAMDYV